LYKEYYHRLNNPTPPFDRSTTTITAAALPGRQSEQRSDLQQLPGKKLMTSLPRDFSRDFLAGQACEMSQ